MLRTYVFDFVFSGIQYVHLSLDPYSCKSL